MCDEGRLNIMTISFPKLIGLRYLFLAEDERLEKIRNKLREEASHGGSDDQGKGVINSQEHELRMAPHPYTSPVKLLQDIIWSQS